VGDLFCRTAHGSLFLDDLGRVQSASLPNISVDEATDFIVHRRRMEAPAQEWVAETTIIVLKSGSARR
jgi:hypothetical protein